MKGIQRCIFALLLVALQSHSAPIVSNTSEALMYLLNFGYVPLTEDTNSASLMDTSGLQNYILQFQAFAGINQTGELDSETLEWMNTPRCGVKDFISPGERAKRYTLQGSNWSNANLTYRITKYPYSSNINNEEIDEEIRQAFYIWEKESSLRFSVKSHGSVHIEIRFESYEHGDGDPFDGPGGTLAHAFFPKYGGDAHFDDSETWTIDKYSGTNLKQTAAHEFGHSLGLSHSDVRSALMAPFYRGWNPDLKLDKDDIKALHRLYGSPLSSKTQEPLLEQPRRPLPLPPLPLPPRRPPPPPPRRPSVKSNDKDSVGANSELCSDSHIDSIFSTSDGNYYVFKGSKYWKLTNSSLASGYPRVIKDDWNNLPNNIDGAVLWPGNEMTYFFKGLLYWKFYNQEPISGYPKLIASGFEGIPYSIDAVFRWGWNGKIYFFKGKEYWKFDPEKDPPVHSRYPLRISNWNLKVPLETAVQWNNGYTYFFFNGSYVRYNDMRFDIDEDDPPFPRPTGPWWFGCESLSTYKKDSVEMFESEGNEILEVQSLNS